jgi:multidrug resistance efflux pump
MKMVFRYKSFVYFTYLILIGALSIAIQGCSAKREVIHPEFQSITESVYASGVVKSRNQYQVFAPTPGVIGKVYITEGDLVKQGQPIVRVNNRATQLSKDNSEIAARYNSLQNNEDKLAELQYNIEVAKEKNEVDSLLYVRQQNLWKQNVGTKVDLEQKELNARNSKATYVSAQLRYDQLKKQLNFAASQSKKAFEITASQANDLMVKSEITGKVFSVLKKQGEMVTSLTPIAVIGESNNFYLELQVDEYDIAKINVNQKVMITMDSYRGKVFEGVVSKIYPMMNERSKTFTLEAMFTKGPEKVYPNLTVEANIIIIAKEKALLIPRNCLLDGDYVIMESGEKRKVETGLMDYQKAEILKGLRETDAIVKPLP